MLRFLVIAIFLVSCAGAPDIRRADVSKLVNGLTAQVDRIALRLDEAKDVVELACVVDMPRCAEARKAVSKASDAVSRARSVIDEAKGAPEKFWLASDLVESALDDVADAVRSAGALR